MGFQIQDGTGSGKLVTVNAGNRLYTNATTKSVDAQINIDSGKVWSLGIENQSPTGVDDYIFYIQNIGDKTLHVTDMRLSSGTATTQVKINAVTGTSSGGTAITPVSRTVGSSASPSATIEVGADITGITSSGTIFFMQLDTTDKEFHLSTSSKIRIPKGQAIGISVETATASLTGIVSLVEESGS